MSQKVLVNSECAAGILPVCRGRWHFRKPEDRNPYMDDDLLAFPYVNGGLFADETIVIPRLDETIVYLILRKASEDFDWSAISPTIFGAVFESTLNPETRRSGGMHYTSIENIHKLIDPLFLDGLKFLDPACGSGNFLTETYTSLRRGRFNLYPCGQ